MPETYQYKVEVDASSEQGAKEAADRIAQVCSIIQEHGAVESVRATIPGPNDFKNAESPHSKGSDDV